MTESIFTKIINGEVPSHKIYEDDNVYAFLDIHPIQPGHTLVVPKKQVDFLWDMEEVDYAALTLAAKKIAAHLRLKLGVPYVGQQVIGVDVPHAHIHLIPFTAVKDFRNYPDQTADPDHELLMHLSKRLAL
ncbi:MAG: HIT domain-containing protein [Chloroflexi bacterium]|nr:MAG: HIT domain-containing protein [Chloroflexota bacterium]